MLVRLILKSDFQHIVVIKTNIDVFFWQELIALFRKFRIIKTRERGLRSLRKDRASVRSLH